MVDLEWKLVPPVAVSRPIPVATYAFELSWRDRGVNVHSQVWESSKKLISANQCRKKNLQTGSTYDFRVRAVEELAGGMLGGRSDWSEVLNVTLKSAVPSPAQSGNGSTSYSSASNAGSGPNTGGAKSSTSSSNTTSDSKHSSKTNYSYHSSGEKAAYASSLDSGSENSVEEDEEEGHESEADEVAEEIDDENNLYSQTAQSREVDIDGAPKTPVKHAWKQRSPDNTARTTNSNGSSSKDKASSGGAAGAGKAASQSTGSKTSNATNAQHNANPKISAAEAARYARQQQLQEEESGLSSEDEAWRPNKARQKAHAKKSVHSSHSSHHNSASKRDSKRKVAVWQQLYDENGNAYYYDPESGESKWEAPEWVEEVDTESGASYYVKLDPYGAHALHSTWSRPQAFAHLIRNAGAYANAQAEAEAEAQSDAYSSEATSESDRHSASKRHSRQTKENAKHFTPKTKTIFESNSNDDDDDDYGEIMEDEELAHAGEEGEDDYAEEVAEEIEEDS